MIKKLLCATLALGPSLGLLLAADVFTGSWKLDVAKSTFASDNPAPKELTLTFAEQGANRTQTLQGIAADGSVTSTAWTAPITGGTANFPAGQGPNGGASVKVVDDKTLLMTQNLRNAKAGASRTYQVSADGTTLILTQKREDGQERAKMVFGRRQKIASSGSTARERVTLATGPCKFKNMPLYSEPSSLIGCSAAMCVERGQHVDRERIPQKRARTSPRPAAAERPLRALWIQRAAPNGGALHWGVEGSIGEVGVIETPSAGSVVTL